MSRLLGCSRNASGNRSVYRRAAADRQATGRPPIRRFAPVRDEGEFLRPPRPFLIPSSPAAGGRIEGRIRSPDGDVEPAPWCPDREVRRPSMPCPSNRHARTCSGHPCGPRQQGNRSKWMPGTSPGMTAWGKASAEETAHRPDCMRRNFSIGALGSVRRHRLPSLRDDAGIAIGGANARLVGGTPDAERMRSPANCAGVEPCRETHVRVEHYSEFQPCQPRNRRDAHSVVFGASFQANARDPARRRRGQGRSRPGEGVQDDAFAQRKARPHEGAKKSLRLERGMRGDFTLSLAGRRRLYQVVEGLALRQPTETAGGPAAKVLLNRSFAGTPENTPWLGTGFRHHGNVGKLFMSILWPVPAAKRVDDPNQRPRISKPDDANGSTTR